MSSNNSDFWSETAGICTVIGLILGSSLAALTLYCTWRQVKQRKAHEPIDSDHIKLENSAERRQQPKWKPFYSLMALVAVAVISFSGTVALAASIPHIQASHSSTSQSTSLRTSTSVPETPTVSTTFSASAASAPTSFPTNYRNMGCYQDYETRIFNASSISTQSMTVPGCAEFCGKYTYFGTEDGFQCFCSNDFPYSFHAADSFCNISCAGNASEICGGFFYLSLGAVG